MTWVDFAGGVGLATGLFLICYWKGLLAFGMKGGEHEGKGSLSQVSFFREICSQARQNLYVVSGETAAVLWEKDEVIKSLEKAIKRGVVVNFCAGPWMDVKSRSLARLINKGKISYYRLHQRNNEVHYWVNDKYHVAYHDPHEDNMEYTITGSRFITQKYIKKFNDLTRGLQHIIEGQFKQAFFIEDPHNQKEHGTKYAFTNKMTGETATPEECQNLIDFVYS